MERMAGCAKHVGKEGKALISDLSGQEETNSLAKGRTDGGGGWKKQGYIPIDKG